jgi:F1F0 ATPase subunit 2
MMISALKLVLIFITGGITGFFFFGGLWHTTKKAMASKTPAIWLFSSFIVRITVTLLVFYLVMGHSWENLLVCLAGFTVARFMVIHLTQPLETPGAIIDKEEKR